MKHLMQLLLLVGILHVSFAQQDPVVSTIYGDIRGSTRQTGAGKAYDEFLGVPFTRPPVGDLRWEKPVVPESWDGIRDANAYGNICTQSDEDASSEDCLYLNIYAPRAAQDHASKNENLPVLVWIHGGVYLFGSGDVHNGALLATNGEIIVVTINYRLSTLGFLSSNSDAAPGNYGLWDQIAALEWVRDNIAAFGGDVSRISIMGQSAGSASVSHLALSPAAKGLFVRVIMISGSSASYFGGTSHQRLTSYRLANHFNCPTVPDEAAVECLRGVSATDLDRFGLLYPPLMDQYLCTQIPVIDSELVSEMPIDAMTSGLNSDYDVLVGSARHDGASFALPFAETLEMVDFYITFMFAAFENGDDLVNRILQQYPNVMSDDVDTRERELVRFTTDYIFGSRPLKEAELHQRTSNRGTYYYEFRHQYSSTDPSWLDGTHSEDLPFIFGREHFEGRNAQLSQYLQAYYSNFVYTGNPNEGPHSVPIEWPQFDRSANQRFIESPEPFVEDMSQDYLDDLEFMNDIYDRQISRVDTDPGVSKFSPERLAIWNRLVKELKKASRP